MLKVSEAIFNGPFLPSHMLSSIIDTFSEELLQQHDNELMRLKHYYETHQELFEAIHKWKRSWCLFQELEVVVSWAGLGSAASPGSMRLSPFRPCRKRPPI